MVSNQEVDTILLSHMSSNWRKVAYVVGLSMLEINPEQRRGLQDLYFCGRVSELVSGGQIEHQGDLSDMRRCEVRLKTG